MTTERPPPDPEKKPGRGRSARKPKAVGEVYPGQRVRSKTETETLPAETAAEVESRLRMAEAKQAHELRKELAVLVATLAVAGLVILAACGVLALSGGLSLRTWATTALTGTFSALVGWLTAKQTAK